MIRLKTQLRRRRSIVLLVISLTVLCLVPSLFGAPSTSNDLQPKQELTNTPYRFFIQPREGAPFHGIVLKATENSATVLHNGTSRTYEYKQLTPETHLRIQWRFRTVSTDKLLKKCQKHDQHLLARKILASQGTLTPEKNRTWIKRHLQTIFPKTEMPSNAGEIKKLIQNKQKQLITEARNQQKKKRSKQIDIYNVYDIRSLVYKGDVSQRVDVVFLPDGWTKKSRKTYRFTCKSLIRAIKRARPFSSYPEHINFHRMSIYENQPGISGMTTLGTSISRHGRSKSVRASQQKVRKVTELAPDTELAVVIANTLREGTKNLRATGSISPKTKWGVLTIPRGQNQISDTLIHELGHAFGDLGDEYVDEELAKKRPPLSGDHNYPNISIQPNLQDARWHYWAFPKPPPHQQIGMYEGAYYHRKNHYRPSPDCRMRNPSAPFCPVCLEQMERSFYQFVTPIDRAHPESPTPVLFRSENKKVGIKAVVTRSRGNSIGKLKANWYLNGSPLETYQARGVRTWTQVDNLNLSPGQHRLTVRVNFMNRRIRRDYGKLSGEHSWNITVLPYEKPSLTISGPKSGPPEKPFKLKVRWKEKPEEAENLEILPLELPPGAVFNHETHRMTWTPEKHQTGAYPFRVGVVNENGRILNQSSRRLRIGKNPNKNTAPQMMFPKRKIIDEGKRFNRIVRAVDPDGDHVIIVPKNLPDAATFDRESGVLSFRPARDHGQKKYKFQFTAHDGTTSTSQTFQLMVRDRRISEWTFPSTWTIKLGLRSPIFSTSTVPHDDPAAPRPFLLHTTPGH